jgi:RHS repeat-associated protein
MARPVWHPPTRRKARPPAVDPARQRGAPRLGERLDLRAPPLPRFDVAFGHVDARRVAGHKLDDGVRADGAKVRWRSIAAPAVLGRSLRDGLDPERSFQPLLRVVEGGDKPDNTAQYYTTDQRGAAIRLTDSDGEVLWSARYDPYGQCHEKGAESGEQPLRFMGQVHDTAADLSHHRFRVYDAELGRFISPDPLGVAGGDNAFSYPADPLAWTDPFGLNPRFDDFMTRNGMTSKPKGLDRIAWQQNDQAYKRAQNGDTFVLGQFHEAQRYADATGGYALNQPANKWNIMVNDEWIRGGIDGGATYNLASDPNDPNMTTHPKYTESVFGRELGQLKAAGYTFDADDPRKLVPPGGCT